MKISHNTYGKGHVRVLRVRRDGPHHDITEATVQVMLEGGFDRAFSEADNSMVVPTDTVKNTVHALAREHLGPAIETFGLALGRHFLKRYGQVSRVTVLIEETSWQRMSIEGKPHPHSFVGQGSSRPAAKVICTRNSEAVESGIADLPILKSTGSGFVGYPKCEFTTLPETTDRILSTKFNGHWTYGRFPADFTKTNAAVLDAMLKVFAQNYSPSVQATIHEMAEAAFAAVPEISRITLALPNKHYLPINLKPFGLENHNEIFLPTDEPHGQIEATLTRD
jgi:urate oxidase